MGLSSNILWHQTNKDALKKILKQKCFRYSYSLECIEFGEKTLKLAFPMLSLCDIPLADIGDYLTKYGGSSIGLSREWGIRYGITPVIYCEKSSTLLKDLGSIISENINKKNERFFWTFLSHIKNHEGKLPKRNYKKYRFYDEREIRIIPQMEELLGIGGNIVLLENEYERYKLQNRNSSLLSDKLNIPFTYNDIRYFILKDEESITEIKNILSKEMDLSQSKICFFTSSQVKSDIIGDNHNETLIIEKIDINNPVDKFPPIVGKIDINIKNK